MTDTNKPINSCNCGCQEDVKPSYPYPCPPPGYWYPDCPPPPVHGCPPPYPYPDCPVTPCGNSIEVKIGKLSKKAQVVRKQIENLTVKNKPIIISIGGCSYNYGVYTNVDGEATEYGEQVLTILQAELEAIKAKIIELTQELDSEATVVEGGVESTVTTEL